MSELLDALRFIAETTTDAGSWAVARRALRRAGETPAGDDNPHIDAVIRHKLS